MKLSNLYIKQLKGPVTEEKDIEIVERKGLGHPDSMCDAIVEEISRSLSEEYRRYFGTILHHNIDKGLLVAGRVERRFGGGRVIEPMKFIFGDRATARSGDKEIPLEEIVIGSAKKWIRKYLRFVDPDKHVRYQIEIKPASAELQSLFTVNKKILGANDTSAAVGYAPLTELEQLVIECESYLNSEGFKHIFPETGEDVKVMGFRIGRKATITIAMPFIDRFIEDEESYFRKKKDIYENVREFLKDRTVLDMEDIFFNTLDREGMGIEGLYLSVLGISAEDSDSGEVGRGNRVNGLIALNRPSGTEAAAGKNAISHIGKIYNILVHKIANDVYTNIRGIREVYVWLANQIGNPIDRPFITYVQVNIEDKVSFADISQEIESLVRDSLTHIDVFCEDLIRGKYPVC